MSTHTSPAKSEAALFDRVPLSDDQVRHFDEQGYLIVRDVLDADTIASLIEAGDRLIAGDVQDNRQTQGRMDSFRNVVSMDEVFASMIAHPDVLPMAVQLLGANIHLMTSHLIYKVADPQGTPLTHRQPGWHRDYYTANIDMGHAAMPRIELKCALYLTDVSEPRSGVTMVSPGSNRLREPLQIPKGQIDPANALEPSLKPGDCLIFENRTYHAGGVNLSGRARKTLMMGYGYRWIVPMDYRTQPAHVLDKFSRLERFMVGEKWDDNPHFQYDGGENPLKTWCLAQGLDVVRHPIW